MKHGAGSLIFRSPAYLGLLRKKNYLASFYKTLRYPALFQDVKTFCLFIGHNKSGTSLIGALLDAHPNVILADEAGSLDYVSDGFSRDQLFHVLLRASKREYRNGRITARRLTPYSYLVPGQWQGRYNRLQVIGDGAANSSARKFSQTPGMLSKLQRLMGGINLKFIHVIRNPYDTISVKMIRGRRTFEDALQDYLRSCRALVDLRSRLSQQELFAVRYEDFVSQPAVYLTQLCVYLGIEANEDYLQSCIGILHVSPDQNRQMVEWTSEQIDLVKEKIEQYDFLQGYSFEK
jgi:hypothetical protein